MRLARNGAHAQFFVAWTPLFSANLSYLTIYWSDLYHWYVKRVHSSKECHCNRNGVKRLSGWSFWRFQPFSLKSTGIGVYVHCVCIIQHIPIHRVTHINLSTCLGSCECQLHFGTKMVFIKLSGCEWLPPEFKNTHFKNRHFQISFKIIRILRVFRIYRVFYSIKRPKWRMTHPQFK